MDYYRGCYIKQGDAPTNAQKMRHLNWFFGEPLLPLNNHYPFDMVKDGNDFYLCGRWDNGTDYKGYIEKRSLPMLSSQVAIDYVGFFVGTANTEYFEDVIVDANYVYTIGRAYNTATAKVNGIVQRRSKTNLNTVDWTYWYVFGANSTSFHAITQDDTYLYVFGQKGPSPYQTIIVKLEKDGSFISSYDPGIINSGWGGISLHTDGYLYLSGEYSGNLAMAKLTTDFTGYIGGHSGVSAFYRNTIVGTAIIGAGGTWDGKLVTQSRPLSSITTVNWTRTQDYVVGQTEYFLKITSDGSYLYMAGYCYNQTIALYQCITLDGASAIWTKEADSNKMGWTGGCIISENDFWVCVWENVAPVRNWIERRSKSDGTVQQSWMLEG